MSSIVRKLMQRGKGILPACVWASCSAHLWSVHRASLKQCEGWIASLCSIRWLSLVQVRNLRCDKPPDCLHKRRMASVQDRERLGTKNWRTKIFISPFSASSPLPTPLLEEEWSNFPTCLANERKQLEPMSLMLCLYNCWQICLKSLALFLSVVLIVVLQCCHQREHFTRSF